MRLRRTSAIAALAIAIALPAIAMAAAPNLLAVLAVPIASARRQHVQVLLPGTIDAHGAKHLYGAGGGVAQGYDMQLAAARGCEDANACFVADFTATKARSSAGTAVELAHGIAGRYVASRCGASCNPAVIRWREYGRTYAIAYLGSRQQMVSLADAAIAAGPR